MSLTGASPTSQSRNLQGSRTSSVIECFCWGWEKGEVAGETEAVESRKKRSKQTNKQTKKPSLLEGLLGLSQWSQESAFLACSPVTILQEFLLQVEREEKEAVHRCRTKVQNLCRSGVCAILCNSEGWFPFGWGKTTSLFPQKQYGGSNDRRADTGNVLRACYTPGAAGEQTRAYN